MPKKFLILLFCLAVVLTACQSAAEEDKVTSGTLPVTTSPAKATSEPFKNPTTSSASEPTSVITPSGPATCTVVSSFPTPGPTEQSLFPPVSDADWVTGSSTAGVTITEYSDFQ